MSERFDTGTEYIWTPEAPVHYQQTSGAGLHVISIWDGYLIGVVGRYLRVDYLSVDIDFHLTDINAAASALMAFTVGSPLLPVISVEANLSGTSAILRATTQITRPFVAGTYLALGIQGVSSGLGTSLITVTMFSSSAYPVPGY